MKMSYYYLRTIFISTLFIIELIQYGSANSIFISGGGYAELGDYPHHAHLQIFHDSHLYVCAGSLIHFNWVLTAAQCVFRFEHIQVYLGVVNRDDGPIKHIISVDDKSHVRIHEDYNPPTVLSNDIAMIYLADSKAEWLDHSHVGAVALPNSIFDDFVGQNATATGFGLTSDDANAGISVKLKYVDMPVITNIVCARTFGNFITELELCTGTARGSTCAGDEGSGLTKEINGVRTIIGIGSFRAATGCTLGHPAVFARVTKFIDWINFNKDNPPKDNSCVCDCICNKCPSGNQRIEL